MADCAIDRTGATFATAEAMTREDNDPMIFMPWYPFLVMRHFGPADICPLVRSQPKPQVLRLPCRTEYSSAGDPG